MWSKRLKFKAKTFFFNEASHLSGNPPIAVHAAEVLHQVDGTKISPGGWVGGDAWFGSVLSTVEVVIQCLLNVGY
jgi:hypothetical protein